MSVEISELFDKLSKTISDGCGYSLSSSKLGSWSCGTLGALSATAPLCVRCALMQREIERLGVEIERLKALADSGGSSPDISRGCGATQAHPLNSASWVCGVAWDILCYRCTAIAARDASQRAEIERLKAPADSGGSSNDIRARLLTLADKIDELIGWTAPGGRIDEPQ